MLEYILYSMGGLITIYIIFRMISYAIFKSYYELKNLNNRKENRDE